jgi:adenylosuccinate synthase
MPRDYSVYLQDILEAIAKVQRYTGPLSGEAFASDEKTIDAVVRNLEVIGEAVKRLPLEIRARRLILERVFGLPRIDLASVRDACLAWADKLRPFAGDAVDLLHEAVATGRTSSSRAPRLRCSTSTSARTPTSRRPTRALCVCAERGCRRGPSIASSARAKAYATHVGSGPFPTEDLGDESRRLRDVGREYGTTTGRPRRCGWFDAVAVRSNGIDALALVTLDVLRGFPRLGICTAYDFPSGRTTRRPASATDVMAAVPGCRELPGFDEDVWGARRFDDLPGAARDFALAIEAECGVPVELVAVGPSREQVIR